MKFYEVRLNQSFSYRGEAYIKTGPLLGTCTESGKKVFIPRHADVLTEQQDMPLAEPRHERTLSASTVVQSLEKFYQECLDCLKHDEIPDMAVEEIKGRLQSSYQSLISRLELDK